MAAPEDSFDSYLYDISDVTFDMVQKKNRREIALIMKADSSDFNLIKTYLSLKAFLEKIENELGILAEADGNH